MSGGDISSISGSDTESTSSDSTDSDDSLTPSLQAFQVPRDCDKYRGFHSRRQKLFFQNSAGEVIALHRCILFGKRVSKSFVVIIEFLLYFFPNLIFFVCCILLVNVISFSSKINQGYRQLLPNSIR